MRRLTKKEKLSILEGISADEVLNSVTGSLPFRATSDIESSGDDSLVELRFDSNKISAERLSRIPRLSAERVDRIIAGRPYYSMAELVAASGQVRPLLEDIFAFEAIAWRDQVTGKSLRLDVVPGRYIVTTPDDTESDDPLLETGYSVIGEEQRLGLRLVHKSDLEDALAPHLLKSRLDGKVFPMLRDGEGFERIIVPGSLDIWFDRKTPTPIRRKILDQYGLVVSDSVDEVGYYRVQIGNPKPRIDLIRAAFRLSRFLEQHAEVRFVEFDQVGMEDMGPGESAADSDIESADRAWNLDIIDLSEAHQISRGSPDVVIFAVDTGVRTDHADIHPGLRTDWNTLDLNYELGLPESAISPHTGQDGNPHGTEVTGVLRQIAPDCCILPLKISATSGGALQPGYGLRAAAVLAAVSTLQPHQRGVMNLSWKTQGDHIGIREALQEAENAGISIVCSAGNYSVGESQMINRLHYPSEYFRPPTSLQGLCSVAATTVDDTKADYSYFGDLSVNICAPGGEYGTDGSAIYTTSVSDPYRFKWGTSFAAPHVAGVLALMYAVDLSTSVPGSQRLTVARAREILIESGDVIDQYNVGFENMMGKRLNARMALVQVLSEIGATPVTPVPEQPDPRPPVTAPTAPGPPVAEPPAPDATARININTATVVQLESLPYISMFYAQQIINYRDQNGPFPDIESLRNVWGIGLWTVQQIAHLITV